MGLKVVKVSEPQELNFVFGWAHFIKMVEDSYEMEYLSGNA